MEAYKYIVDVDKMGKIKLPKMPQIKSRRVEVIVIPIQSDDYSDLVNASESSIQFWNNPDDEAW